MGVQTNKKGAQKHLEISAFARQVGEENHTALMSCSTGWSTHTTQHSLLTCGVLLSVMDLPAELRGERIGEGGEVAGHELGGEGLL